MKSKHIMTIFACLMLLYQAWRVFDYMGSSLTGVPDAVRLVVSIAFLAFSELGLLTWLHIAQPNATTDLQESVSAGMIWIDFAGSMIVGLGDMLKHNTMYEVNLSSIDPLLFLAPWLMVVLNIAGYLVYVQNDSDAKLDREERRLRHEEHSLDMAARRAAIRELRSNQEGIASELAPHYFKHVKDRVTGRTVARFVKQSKAEDILSQALPMAKPSSNGRNYNAETEIADPNGLKGDKP